MLRGLYITCFMVFGVCNAQIEMELTPAGFEPVSVVIPATPTEKLVELSKAWALEYNIRKEGADITNVSDNTITISAYRNNAFFYRNNGVPYEHKIRYTMKLDFTPGGYTLFFTIVDIYHNDVLLEYKIPDYFTSEGKLKDGYNGLDESLLKTVNGIVNSHYNYLINFR